eukprot:15894159-Heterocapsa_arctica.AAC.1
MRRQRTTDTGWTKATSGSEREQWSGMVSRTRATAGRSSTRTTTRRQDGTRKGEVPAGPGDP